MTIYNYLELLLFVVFVIETNKNENLDRKFFYFLGAFCLLIILGFRNIDVGGDTPGYCSFFVGKNDGFYGSQFDQYSEIEIGFVVFCRLLYFFSSDWRWFIFATSLFSLIPFLWYVKNESYNKSFAYMAFLLPWGLLFLIQTPLRQVTAVTLFLCGGYLITQKSISVHQTKLKIIFGLLLILWGALTHSSMYIMIPLAIITYFVKINKRTSIVLIISTFVISLLVRSLFTYIYDYLFLLTASFDAFHNINQYYDSSNYEIADTITFGAVAPRTIFALLVISLTKIDQFKNFNYKCMIIGCCVLNIGISFPLASRMAYLFLLVGASFVPKNFNNLVEQNNMLNISKILLVVLFMLIMYKHYELCSTFVKQIESDILPYSFWFEHIF